MTVAGMLESTKAVKVLLQKLRMESNFDDIMKKVENKITKMNLEPLSIPRIKQVPKRFTGSAEAYQPKTISDYFRVHYYKILDIGIQQLDDRILDCPGI